MLSNEAKELTIFESPFGKYQFKRMPFGLKNAPAVFQALMEKVLGNYRSFSAVYIDDVLVFLISWEEHLVHVGRVMEVLREGGLTVKPSK